VIPNTGKLIDCGPTKNHDVRSGRSLHRSQALDKATEAVLYHDWAQPRKGRTIGGGEGEPSHRAEGMPANDDEQ